MIKQIVKFLFFKMLYPACYELFSLRKVKSNKIVFVENNHRELSNNFYLLYHKMKETNRYKVEIAYLKKYKSNVLNVIWQNTYVLFKISNAKVIFIDEGCSCISCCLLREESKLINVWHGCGVFKKFGYSSASKIFGMSEKEFALYPEHRHYAYVTVSAPAVIDYFADAMNMKEEKEKIIPIGVSRTDIFFSHDFRETALLKLRKLFPQCKGKKIILYAPTFRGQTYNAAAPDAIDWEYLYSCLKEEYFLLIKEHPLIKEKIKLSIDLSDFCADVTDVLSIDELLAVSDILVTDYSTVIFEFSLFQRPMIFFAYDLEDYIKWRGFYFDYEQFVPGPIVRDNEQLAEAIKQAGSFDRQRVENFKNRFMASCDGRSTERIIELVDQIIAG